MAAKKNKTVIVLTGPTASGKTAVAIRLAQFFNTEIISADSRQCFKELKIGVARPSEEELNKVPHHFIASHSVSDEMNASVFEKYVLEKTEGLFKKHDKIVMVGGTGLYIKAFCEGLDDIPEVSKELHQSIIDGFKTKGLQWLQEQVAVKDPQYYQRGEMQNPQRIMRALEVMEATGSSILDFRKGKKAIREFSIIKIGVGISKEDLHRNINTRVEEMVKAGLVEEVKELVPFKDLNALQTVGYSEIFDFLNGNTTLQKAIELIKTNTRQYAKRQLTWFRKDQNIQWFNPDELEKIKEALI